MHVNIISNHTISYHITPPERVRAKSRRHAHVPLNKTGSTRRTGALRTARPRPSGGGQRGFERRPRVQPVEAGAQECREQQCEGGSSGGLRSLCPVRERGRQGTRLGARLGRGFRSRRALREFPPHLLGETREGQHGAGRPLPGGEPVFGRGSSVFGDADPRQPLPCSVCFFAATVPRARCSNRHAPSGCSADP